MIPEELRYTSEHEWIRLEEDGTVGVVGITHHAQQELGDIVFVELPEVGDTIEADKGLGTVESVKAVSELYAPVSGEVIEINPDLGERPEMINEDAYGNGWMLKIRLSDTSQVEGLLDAAGYGKHLGAIAG